MEEISNNWSDRIAIYVDDGFIIRRGGNKHPKKTTRGWELLTQFKEGFSKWMPLKDIKGVNWVELSGYVVVKNIDCEPYFSLWGPFTLRKRNMIFSKLQNKFWCTIHKFGTEVQTLVKRTYEINNNIRIKFWRNYIAKEILKLEMAYVEK